MIPVRPISVASGGTPVNPSILQEEEENLNESPNENNGNEKLKFIQSEADDVPYIKVQLIPWSTIPMVKPVLNELVERKIKNGDTFRVGRQVLKDKDKDPAAPPSLILDPPYNKLDIWFLSKVVSRFHAEFTVTDGTIYLRDAGSSSGTFVNKNRLSPSTKPSNPVPIKEGDIIQFGVDYKGKPDDIYKSITVRVGFYDQSWVHEAKKKANGLKFRQKLKGLVNSTNPAKSEKDAKTEEEDPEQVTECCICIGETGPLQALFLAPCSHCFHYKCVAAIIVQSAMFQCPLCRQVANLTASVSCESLNEEGVLKPRKKSQEEDDNDGNKGALGKWPDKAEMAANLAAQMAAIAAAAAAEANSPKKGRSSFTQKLSNLLTRKSHNHTPGPSSAPVEPTLPAGIASTDAQPATPHRKSSSFKLSLKKSVPEHPAPKNAIAPIVPPQAQPQLPPPTIEIIQASLKRLPQTSNSTNAPSNNSFNAHPSVSANVLSLLPETERKGLSKSPTQNTIDEGRDSRDEVPQAAEEPSRAVQGSSP